MENWDRLMRRLAAKGWVGTPADARACDVSESTWHRNTRVGAWGRPYTSVRVAPWAPRGPRTDLRAALAAARGHGAASGQTAMWVAGVGGAPRRLEVMLPHGVSTCLRNGSRLRVRRARWLSGDDMVVEDGIARLAWPAVAVSLAGRRLAELRGLLIDAVQAGRLDLDDALTRLATTGPVAGRGGLERTLCELGGRRPESWFHDIVLADLEARGYPVGREPLAVSTPDGRGVVVDIPLQAFHVGVEPEGDRYHQDRGARRNDRRRSAQTAGTDWRLVPVDWRDWHQRRPWVLATLDAAILHQLRAGVGSRRDLPPHLRDAGDEKLTR